MLSESWIVKNAAPIDSPLWVVSGLSRTQGAIQAVADFIVASERCKTVRQTFVANIICKNSMPESVRLIGELVANFIVGPHMLAPVSLIMLLVCIALTIWVGKDLYAIVFEGEICRPRYRCESWSSNPVSLGAQCLGFTLLTTIFVALGYRSLKVLLGPASDDQA